VKIAGVGGEFAEILEASGVDSVPELAQRNTENLAARLNEVNETRKLVRRVPSASQLGGWVEEAGSLERVVTH
jgi:uroporphyrinogen-III synthase